MASRAVFEADLEKYSAALQVAAQQRSRCLVGVDVLEAFGVCLYSTERRMLVQCGYAEGLL